MSFASTLLRRMSRRIWVRVMERAGKLVGRWVDTSADAPDANFAPKRDLYRTMQNASPADSDGGHDHGH